jgi:hypothetical protein
MDTIRPEVTGRHTGISRKPSFKDALPKLTALDLERHVSVPEAAKLKGISPDTFKRHFGHLIRRPSPRRSTVKLRDLLSEENAA